MISTSRFQVPTILPRLLQNGTDFCSHALGTERTWCESNLARMPSIDPPKVPWEAERREAPSRHESPWREIDEFHTINTGASVDFSRPLSMVWNLALEKQLQLTKQLPCTLHTCHGRTSGHGAGTYVQGSFPYCTGSKLCRAPSVFSHGFIAKMQQKTMAPVIQKSHRFFPGLSAAFTLHQSWSSWNSRVISPAIAFDMGMHHVSFILDHFPFLTPLALAFFSKQIQFSSAFSTQINFSWG